MNIKYFSVLGERCSGTNFLTAAINTNFDIIYSTKYTHKHFFGFNDFTNSNDHLFIGIIRHPIDWLNSLWDQKHNLAIELFKNENIFLNNEITSYDYSYDFQNDENQRFDLKKDYNLLTKNDVKPEKYNNIFELRKVKTDYLRYEMPKKVKNYIFINYETLRDKYSETLTMIKEKFNLSHHKKNFKKIKSYKGKLRHPYKRVKKRFLTTENIIKKLDIEFENSLGYTKFD